MIDISKDGILHLLRRLSGSVSGSRAHEAVVQIQSLDRTSSFSDYERSCDLCLDLMRQAGLSVIEKHDFPADGRTKIGDWKMPLAWDAGEAVLEIAGPEPVVELARRSRQPQSLIMWSAPTPPGGVEAEAVLLIKEETPEEIGSLDLRRKIVFTSRHPGEMKRHIAQAGAWGLVSDWLRNKTLTDAVQWINTWSDTPGGWAMHESDSRLFGFTLSRHTGETLRRRIEKADLAGEKVRFRAQVESRLYAGSLHYAVGAVQGTGPGEVLAMAHINEQGANDNASGAAVLLEAARILRRHITEGILPLPHRTVRFLLMPESYGTMAYAIRNVERLKQTACALNVDGGAGAYDSDQANLDIVLDPMCCSDKTADLILVAVAQSYYNEIARRPDKWGLKKYTLAGDNFFCEPMIGVPHPWLDMGDGGDYWHNSEDTPDKVDPRSLHDLATVTAAYLYLMAAGEEDSLKRIAAETLNSLADDQRRLMPPLPATGILIRDNGTEAVRPKRAIVGALTLDGLPFEQWEVVDSSPRWWSPYLAAWWWANGHYSIGQIAGLIRAEFGSEPGDLRGFFEFLRKQGYVAWR
ncbi:MAG: DUF4910 domain-containing protein [Armatimonadetes bacterium]|nr:DUF4910 domain-containing protein [Armatimonadota bacterium]